MDTEPNPEMTNTIRNERLITCTWYWIIVVLKQMTHLLYYRSTFKGYQDDSTNGESVYIIKSNPHVYVTSC